MIAFDFYKKNTVCHKISKIFLIFILVIGFGWLALNGQGCVIRFETTTQATSGWQLYFSKSSPEFSEDRSSTGGVKDGSVIPTANNLGAVAVRYLDFPTPQNSNFFRLDWDPGVISLPFSVKLPAGLVISGSNQVNISQSANWVHIASYSKEQAPDPWILLSGSLSGDQFTPIERIWAPPGLVFIFQAFLLTAAILYLSNASLKNVIARFVPPILFGMYFCAAIILSQYSSLGKHPDELNHIQSVLYFNNFDVWYIGNYSQPRFIETIGNQFYHSYLFSHDIYYLIIGKLFFFNSFFFGGELRLLRLIHTFVVGALFLGAFFIQRPTNRPIFALPLLVPQVWYTSSYICSDGFALGICLLVTSMVLRIYQREKFLPLIYTGAVFLCCGLCLCLKVNFAIIGILSFAIVFYFSCRAHKLSKVIIVCLIAFVPLLITRVPTYMSNDWSPKKIQNEMKNANAVDSHSPKKSEFSLMSALRNEDRVIPIVFTKDWYISSAWSHVGVFGYMKYRIPWQGPAIFFITILIVFGWKFIELKLRAGILSASLFPLYIMGVTAIVLSTSLVYSLTAGYQAQGRYLFAIYPLIALSGIATRLYPPKWAMAGFLAIGFCLLYLSFISISNAHELFS